MLKRQLKLKVHSQPNDTSCGPTCLHALYRYWNYRISLNQIIDDIKPLPGGGTLAVSLACHAIRRGFEAKIYTYDLDIFDPTWFSPEIDIGEKLRKQQRIKRYRKLIIATKHYLEYLSLGGKILYHPLNGKLIRSYLNQNIPILTGLSATHLYDSAREFEEKEDDIRGRPVGHFVMLSGYDRQKRHITVADPLHDNPRFNTQYYQVAMDRLIASILLGTITYDANLLILKPKGQNAHGGFHRSRK